jgi:hypothetical protein
LVETWERHPAFMLESYLLWTPPAAHSLLKKEWPPVVNGQWKTMLLKQARTLVSGVGFKRIVRQAMEDDE